MGFTDPFFKSPSESFGAHPHMVGIFASSLILRCLAVVLAFRLSWKYRQYRSWWLISSALFLMMLRTATSFYQYLTTPEDISLTLLSELTALNVSVLMVVGLWLLEPLFRSLQEAEIVLRNHPVAQEGRESELIPDRRKPVKLAEDDLNAMYHSLVETLPMSIIRKDGQGRFVFVNSAACEMLDSSRDELLNKTDADLFEPELAQKYHRDDQRVLETGKAIEDVEEFRDHTGELRHVQILKTPVFDSRKAVVGTQVIFWDVTQRRQAIEALARNEAIKTAMFEAALESIITIDGSDRILEFNPAAAKVFGYDRQEAIGQEMGTLLMPEQARERHLTNLAQYLGSGEAGSLMFGRLAVPMKRKDGSQFTAELSMQPIPLDNSTGFTVFLRDITERERTAMELARQQKTIEHANTVLQQEVQERRKAEEETKLRNRDLRTLLYVISHDLREPLRAVRNFANLIRDNYADRLDDKGRDFLDRIIRAAGRLDRQLEDVLMLSRAAVDRSQRTSAPERSRRGCASPIGDANSRNAGDRSRRCRFTHRVGRPLVDSASGAQFGGQRFEIYAARRQARDFDYRVSFRGFRRQPAWDDCRRPWPRHFNGTRRASFRSLSTCGGPGR